MSAWRPLVLLLLVGAASRAQAGPDPSNRIPIGPPFQAPATPLLLAGGTTTPGDSLRLNLYGAPPIQPTWLAWSHAAGFTPFGLGSAGTMSLALSWPVAFVPVGNSDAAGQLTVAIPINPLLPADYLQGLQFHFQLVTLELAAPGAPGWRVHVSNDGRATDQHQEAQSWAALKAAAIASIQLAPGWGPARLVEGPLNSIGWEDSAAIAPDGLTLYCSYIPCDLMSWTGSDQGRIDRFNRHRRGPTRGVTPEYSLDVLVCSGSGQTFGPPSTSPVSLNATPRQRSEAGLVPVGTSFFYSADGPLVPGDSDTDIYRDDVRLPFCTEANENDPSVQSGVLLFWSDDLGGAPGRYRIFQTFGGGASWTPPVALAAPVNLPGSDSWQPHLTPDGWLYFASNRGGPLGIWKCARLATNSWSVPEPVASPAPGSAAVAVAEPSLTLSGAWLYFCVLFRNAEGAFDLDIACSPRLP